MKISKLAVVLILTFLLYPLIGQTKSADVLVLTNGDRITGEITRIWDAEITIEPEYSDEFNVDIPAVACIESEREFEIDLGDHRHIGEFSLFREELAGVTTKDQPLSTTIITGFSMTHGFSVR